MIRNHVFFRFNIFAASLILFFASGCVIDEKRGVKTKRAPLLKISPRDFPDFKDDLSYEGLERAITENIRFLEKKPGDALFHFGEHSVEAFRMIESLSLFLDFVRKKPSSKELKKFIGENFKVYGSSGNINSGEVLFTGYFEPVFKGSLTRNEVYRFPVYGRPKDLIRIDLSKFSPEYAGKDIIARYDGETAVPYFDRKKITFENVLENRAETIAWLKDPVDLFFLHIQGSGKALLQNGETVSLRYDSQNGRPYRSIGKLLIETNRIPKSEMSMQSIRTYLAEHPDEIDKALNHNPSYVFFRRGYSEYPKGCLDAELTPGRSIATDRKIFPDAALAFIKTGKPIIDVNGRIEEWTAMSRFVLNQDTGGAIRGAGRADIFWGAGRDAEITAGHMRHEGELFFLAPKN